jgi:hypothetical protein
MIVSDGAFPAWKVAHRGNVAAEVLEAAMTLVGRFKEVGTVVERMRNTYLTESQRLAFASDALRLRYPDEPLGTAVAPADLLRPGRVEDEGRDVRSHRPTFRRTSSRMARMPRVRTTRFVAVRRCTPPLMMWRNA